MAVDSSSFSSLNLFLGPLFLYLSVSIQIAKATPSLWQHFDSLLLSIGLSLSLSLRPSLSASLLHVCLLSECFRLPLVL